MLSRLIRPAAYAWIVEDEHVLLCRLCEPHNRGLWTLPGGGPDFGEAVDEGCLREVREETGLTVKLGSILAADSVCGLVSPLGATFEAKRLYNIDMSPASLEMYSVRIVYVATVTGGTLVNELDGSTDVVEWVPLAEMSQRPLVDLAATVLAAWERHVNLPL